MDVSEKQIEFISFLDRELPALQAEGQFFTRERMSNNQVFGALTTFARGVNLNSIIGITDANDKYDGKEGVLFSTSAVYFSDADFPNGKHGHMMVLYKDLLGASASGSLLNAMVTIDVKNLPFESFNIKDMTIDTNNFAQVINRIVDYLSDGFECESDRKESLSAVCYYMEKKEQCMSNVYRDIIQGNKLNLHICSYMDGLGLTPLHYCMLLGNEQLAASIAVETAKFYKDIYLDGQPFGLYNYCFLAAYKDYRGAFQKIYECSTKMEPIMKQKKQQMIKQGMIRAADFGMDFIPGGNVIRAGVDLARNKIENDAANSLFQDDFVRNHWDDCKEKIAELKNGERTSDDPRDDILIQLYEKRSRLENHIMQNKKLVIWNKRYFYLTEEEINSSNLFEEVRV